MAAPPATATAPKVKDPAIEQKRINRGLTKLKDAFTTDLKKKYGTLLTICNTAAGSTSIKDSSHKDVLCNYITSAVRGTYGNKKSTPGGPVFSGLDRTHRCKFLRICMKYLMHHSCISESDVKEILRAMEPQVKSWRVGEGSEKAKEKNKKAFGQCLLKKWDKRFKGENELKCKVINKIKASDRGKPEQLEKIKPSGGGSGTCTRNYEDSCNNGTAGVGGVAAGVAAAGDDVDSEEEDDDDDEDDDDEDDVHAVGVTSTQSPSSVTGQGMKGHSSPSLPGGKGNGNLLFPSLSSFPFDSIHPYLPLVPPVLGIITITYFLWKYFAQLRKIRLYRRAPLRIPGPSVQEQVLDHADEAASHEYRLVKERKPRSAPTRTKRSGPVNRRTIIEIHFEVLDECQKGNTKLTQNDFLELLVQEFMGSELMEEEQVSKEEVLMEGVPMERVPNLGSVFMV